MADRVFTDEELKQMGERTLDSLMAAIDSGDKEKSRKLALKLFREFQGMHNLYLDWITGLQTYIYNKHGDQEHYDALHFACSAWLKPFADMYANTPDMRRKALLFASGLKGHLVPLKVEEDEDKITFMMTPCGSGGTLETGKSYDEPKKFAKIKKAQPQTLGLENFSVYCAHCAFQEILPIEWHGAPMVICQPPAPEKIGEVPCRLLMYKDPTKIPEKFYKRVGKKKA